MNSIEEYKNIIELLKQALNFYANIENYKGNRTANMYCSGTSASLVEMDEGSQARFALEKLKIAVNINEELETEFTKNIENMIINNENIDSISNAIENFRKLAENYGNKI